MKRFLTVSLAALALLVNACEKHPLPGDPHPAHVHGAGHAEGEAHDQAAGHSEGTGHGEGAKAEGSPKFFPEKH